MPNLALSPQFAWTSVYLANQTFSALDSKPDAIAMYRALEMYYNSNGLYDALNAYAYESAIWVPGMKPLMNPTHRAIEFYVAKIWPGKLPDALPIVAENQRIIEPIKRLWAWSNWSVKKQLASRWFSLFGDLFLKASTNVGVDGEVNRVFMRIIKPENVIDFQTDNRGFIEYARIDIPISELDDEDKFQPMVWVEIWDKNADSFTVFKHSGKIGEQEKLGEPIRRDRITDFGIDFIPIVHAQFTDVGGTRGVGAVTHALDKIDEASRQATRLYQLLFRYNKPIFGVSAGGHDALGRPLPPPRIGRSGNVDTDIVEMEDDQILRLPGNSKLESLIPNIRYGEALQILQNYMEELEKDLPELAYYRMRELGSDISGRAVRLLLSDAVDRAVEARGNAESALARAHAMGLTLMKNHNLVSDIGTFEDGDFEHSFAERDVIPTSGYEQAQEAQTWVSAGVTKESALEKAGWSEEEIKKELKRAEDETKKQEANLAQSILSAQRSFDAGEQNLPEDEELEDGLE